MTKAKLLRPIEASSRVDPKSQDGGTIVSHTPGAFIDIGGANDTTVLAYGYGDEVNLIGYLDFEGSGNTVHLLGDASVVSTGGGGANAIFLQGRNDTVSGSAFPGSNDTITATGKGAVIAVGGDNTVLLRGTDARVSILGTRPGDSDSPLNSSEVIASGSGKATVTGGGASFSFSGDNGSYIVNGGDAENATISGGAGGGVFTGGTYVSPYPYGDGDTDGRYFYVGNNTITAGAQRSTLVGGSHGSSILIANGTAHDVLIAGQYGRDILTSGTSTVGNLYEGYRGAYVPTDDIDLPSLLINAGSGNDTLVAGNAAETLTGGSGRDLFRFIGQPTLTAFPPGGGSTLITDFTPGTDKIDLQGSSKTAQQVVAGETIRGGSTTLFLSDNAVVTLSNVTNLSVKDFTFSGS